MLVKVPRDSMGQMDALRHRLNGRNVVGKRGKDQCRKALWLRQDSGRDKERSPQGRAEVLFAGYRCEVIVREVILKDDR
jgi:hypothetical protein